LFVASKLIEITFQVNSISGSTIATLTALPEWASGAAAFTAWLRLCGNTGVAPK